MTKPTMTAGTVPATVWTRKTGFPIAVAARMLDIPKPEFYGVMRAYGVTPVQSDGTGRRGKPPRIVTGEQLEDIRRRLRAVAGAG